MDNYDPNMTNSGKMATQTVELTFQLWEYRRTMTVTVGGNCTGLRVIGTAVSNAFETLYDENAGCHRLTLEDPVGSVLETMDEDDEYEDWLGNMLVEAKITDIEPQEI